MSVQVVYCNDYEFFLEVLTVKSALVKQYPMWVMVRTECAFQNHNTTWRCLFIWPTVL